MNAGYNRWRGFVERHRDLRDDYPCPAPPRRNFCPRHGSRVPQQMHVRRFDPDRGWIRLAVPLSGICKPCRDGLYAQVTTEYVAAQGRQEGEAA